MAVWIYLYHHLVHETVTGGKMTKKPTNHGKAWRPQQVQRLKTLAKQNTPTRVIGLKLGRTPESIYAKAGERGVSLKPVNQSPYNRRKK